MKLLIFTLAVCAVRILECNSLNFGSLFGSSPSKSKNIPPSESALSEDEQKPNNVSFSSEEEKEHEYNVSMLFLNELIKNITDSNNELEYFSVSNSADKILNYSDYVYSSSESYSDINQEMSEKQYFSESDELNTLTKTSKDTPVYNGTYSNVTLSSSNNTTSSIEEQEKVVIDTEPSTFTVFTRTVYQKTVDWVSDSYTLSILCPIASGILFAVIVILLIATCRCIKKKCRRRRFRKNVLPDSIKRLRPSDQAKLLGDCCDSSDEF